MKKEATIVTRRWFLRGSIGAAATVASAPLVAATTPRQTEGPFYPVHEERGCRAGVGPCAIHAPGLRHADDGNHRN